MGRGSEIGELGLASAHPSRRGGPYAYASTLIGFAGGSIARPPLRVAPRILDLRCGTGQLIRRFVAAGWSAVGVDVCESLVAAARRMELGPSAQFSVVPDVSNLDLPAAEFDLIVGFDDLADELTDPQFRSDLFPRVHDALVIGGHFVLEVGASSEEPASAVLDSLRSVGFFAAWTASPIALDMPMTAGHEGPRGLFVARRDL